jgi:hypothetical protein
MTVSAFGIGISNPLIMMTFSLSLIPICCFYLGIHLKHLRELNQFQPVDEDRTEHFRDIARTFPWVVTFSGWEASTVTVASILLLPSVTTYALGELPLARFALLLPCLYTAWQAHILRHQLFENGH